MREIIDHTKRICVLAFVPHEANAYRPHILHPRRTLGYAVAFVVMKAVLLVSVVMVPLSIFASPEAVRVQERELFAMVNAARRAAGVAPLTTDARLDRSSRGKAADMITRQYFAHVNDDGWGPEYFAGAAGYPYAVVGENLAMGYASAREVVEAWKASPTHARNLVDPLFLDEGFGVMGGTYRGTPVVVIAQHLGKQQSSGGAPLVVRTPSRPAAPAAPATTPREEDAAPPAPAIAVRAASASWTGQGNRTAITATATIEGPVRDATVEVRGIAIALTPSTDSPTSYAGSVMLPEAPADALRVVTPPTLSVADVGGSEVVQSISWTSPPVFAPTIGRKYAQVKAVLPETFGPIFGVSRVVYGVAFALFAIAWLVNFLVEIRRQHVDLLVPGGALVLLLGFLLVV